MKGLREWESSGRAERITPRIMDGMDMMDGMDDMDASRRGNRPWLPFTNTPAG